MTTRQMIRDWLNRDDRLNATHMLVVCDTFDWEDYPVFVKSSENIYEIMQQYDGKNMQKIMEIYNLSMDINKQLSEIRTWNI